MGKRGGLRLGPDGKPLQGRRPGIKNKKTVEREKLAEQQLAAAQQAEAAAARRAAEKPKRLAKEVLEDFMHVAAGYAARWQPIYDAAGKIVQGDEAKFRQWSELAYKWASALAPFQSPTFKAVAWAEAPPLPPRDGAAPGDGAKLVGSSSSDAAERQRAYLRLVRGEKAA